MPRDEDTIVNRIRAQVRIPTGSALVAGIGDDCAVYRPPGSREDLLFTTDQLIENVHFRRQTHPPRATGHKALARGLSDIAAMGGVPKFCLVSLALPPWPSTSWVSAFYRGLLDLARRTGTLLAGGDLAHSAQLSCDVVVCGAIPRGKAMLRSGARPGDAIYVSGSLGGSALGLSAQRGKARQRHLWPEPRLALGKFIRTRLRPTAAMDLSDGLSMDLRRLSLASRVSARIEAPPMFPGASLEEALHGGEDYELLFTVPPDQDVPPLHAGIPLTKIGVMGRGTPGAVFLDGKPLAPLGYDHFRHHDNTGSRTRS